MRCTKVILPSVFMMLSVLAYLELSHPLKPQSTAGPNRTNGGQSGDTNTPIAPAPVDTPVHFNVSPTHSTAPVVSNRYTTAALGYDLTLAATSKAASVSTSQTPIMPGEMIPPPGERMVAMVAAGGRQLTLVPNQTGDFQRVLIDPKQTVSIQINFPDGDPGETVAVEEEDGGVLDDKDHGKPLTLDESKNIHFNFSANADTGIYRVTVFKSGVARMLNFWAGPELPIATR